MVHPSIWEGFPRTIIESLACEVPVIALSSTIKGIITHDVHGLLVEEKDLINNVKELLSNEKLIKEMGKNGRELANKFDKDSTIPILKTMYERIF